MINVKRTCRHSAFRYSLVTFLVFLANIHDLKYVVIGRKLQRTNIDLDVVLQEFLGQITHLFRPRSRPH